MSKSIIEVDVRSCYLSTTISIDSPRFLHGFLRPPPPRSKTNKNFLIRIHLII